MGKYEVTLSELALVFGYAEQMGWMEVRFDTSAFNLDGKEVELFKVNTIWYGRGGGNTLQYGKTRKEPTACNWIKPRMHA